MTTDSHIPPFGGFAHRECHVSGQGAVPASSAFHDLRPAMMAAQAVREEADEIAYCNATDGQWYAQWNADKVAYRKRGKG